MKIFPVSKGSVIVRRTVKAGCLEEPVNSQGLVADTISFKGISTFLKEKEFKKCYNMTCKFMGNDLIADCTEKTIKIFEHIFGKNSLPEEVIFGSFQSIFG